MLRCGDVMNPRSPCLCDLLAYEYAPGITKSYTPRSSGARVLDYYTSTSWHGTKSVPRLLHAALAQGPCLMYCNVIMGG